MSRDEKVMNDILEIDRLIHEPARLLIMMYLEKLNYCDFIFLINQTGLTKGNLSSHIRKLEEAGYVVVDKKIVNRHTNTVFSLTDNGHEQLSRYKMQMNDFLK
jgi:DNA-binding MarR family transcriptional regulator